ncbi:osmotically inducible protein C [Halobacteriales archaeon SW_8_68_21]|nr:MAG: osmotically inducible protein C [Halobacteriales archaeon SW_8_68_21]
MSDANATQRMEVRGESDGESKFVAEARNHELVMDDPEAMGGEDAGAMPIEYLLAAWTGCLNATVRAVAPDFDLDRSVMSGGVADDTLAEFTAAVEERCPVSDNLAVETPPDMTLRRE